MIQHEFEVICSYALVGYEGVDTLRILAVEPTPAGPMVRWEAPGMSTQREQVISHAGFQGVGPPTGPMLLTLLTSTLAARWRHGSPRCAMDWREDLQRKFPKVFGADDPSVGPGWSWLFEAGAQAIRDRGVPRNFRTEQTKEKFGAARWYWCAEEAAQHVGHIINSVEKLSAHICEYCGRPGRLRKGGWAKTLCEMHADSKSAR